MITAVSTPVLPAVRRNAPSLPTPQASESAPTDAVQLSAAGPCSDPASSALARTALDSALQQAGNGAPGPVGATLKVLSFNIKFDGEQSLDQVENLIRTTGADLVGLQESNQATQYLADRLGMHSLQQDKRTALLSRFPIEKVTRKKYGVLITADNGRKVGFLNAHLTSFPYQPHQLCHLNTGGGPYLDTEAQAVAAAKKTRGKEVVNYLADAAELGESAVGTGDFNEPSHLDWTPAAAAAGRHPIKCEWPASKAFADAGFHDSYRELNPDEMAHPGNTWTPDTSPDDPKDHHDRIDFVYHRGDHLRVKSVQIVGESEQYSDLVVTPYPSDHRAVLTTFEVD